jgi:uncharacterized protein YndB with AHSA1/START domain
VKGIVAFVLCVLAFSAAAQEKALRKTVTVKAPLAEVWNSWTTAEGIKSFFAPDAKVEARPDGPFEVYFDPYAEPGNRGAYNMRVLAVDEPKMLSFTWNAPPSLPEARKQRTYVTLRFKPVSEKETELTLYHGGWGEGGEWDKAYAYFDRAWSGVLANLQKRFESGPTDWTDWLRQLREMKAKAK